MLELPDLYTAELRAALGPMRLEQNDPAVGEPGGRSG
jgi:hypothetical protein